MNSSSYEDVRQNNFMRGGTSDICIKENKDTNKLKVSSAKMPATKTRSCTPQP